MYLSRADQACYPLRTVYESVAPIVHEFWVCTAGLEDSKLVAAWDLDVVEGVLPLVECPDDIGRLLTISLREVRARSKADLFVLVQADTAAVTRNLARLFSVLATSGVYRSAALQLGTADARLYHHASYGWGYSIFGADAVAKFISDGVAPTAAHLMIAAPDVYCAHLGFLSVDGLLSHYELNGRVWNDRSLCELHALGVRDREAFIREVLIRHSRAFRAPLSLLACSLDSAVERYVEVLGLEVDRELVRRIAADCDPGWPF